MRLLHQCFSKIEPALTSYEKSHLSADFLPYTCKVPALTDDLQQLEGWEANAATGGAPMDINNFGTYLGARYVLEGSAQGGIFIANCLEKSSPDLRDNALRFWLLQRQVAGSWPAFLLMLAQLDHDSAGQESAILAARKTFDLFLAVFSGGSHDRIDP
jgi:heme oxygenase